MSSDVQKYKAQFFQISGFALMSPLGKMVLNIFELKEITFSTIFFILFGIALVMFAGGIMLTARGLEHLE